MTVQVFEEMLGKTFSGVIAGVQTLDFMLGDDVYVRFAHEQDCCEGVRIEEVIGDLDDLVGSPILQAEQVSSEGAPPPGDDIGSYTWTFYKFATIKGSVTVRWLGISNGYYSESVEYYVIGEIKTSSCLSRDV